MNKKKVIVLGAGRVGRVIARVLNDDPEISVTVADRQAAMLSSIAAKLGCQTISDNLSDPDAVSRVVAGFDLAIGALPGALGLSTLRGVVAAGTDCDPGRPGPRGHELPRLARLPVERDDAIGPITANQAVSGTVRKRPARIAESTCMHVLVPYLSHVSSALHLDAFAFIPCPVLNSAPVGCHARALRRGFALENSNSGHGTWTGTQD